MAEIILSFFAVIGMLFILIYLCDYLFYRNFNQSITITIDTRNMTIENCIDTFELINIIRQTSSGKAFISNLNVVVSNYEEEKVKLAKEYMTFFHIEGSIQIIDEK